jgi:hypothetical protein
MIAIALSVLLTLTADNPQVAVDRIEINEFGLNDGLRKQVILWRWVPHPERPGYRVAQWWIIEQELSVVRKRDGWIVYAKGFEMFTRTLKRTRTVEDPEMFDRAFLDPEQRVPFLPHSAGL